MSILHVAFYPSDWLAGTRGLSDVETGVYITLIARMYEMAGPIERDDARLSRLCGSKTKSSFAKALNYLIQEGKIQEVNGELFNERVQKEIKKVIEKSSKASDAANARWDKKPNKNKGGINAGASPKHMPTACQLEPEPDIEGTNVPSARATRFDEFWDAFPHRNGAKKGRKGAEAKYRQAVRSGVSEQTLITAAWNYQGDADVQRGYGKGPIPWLNQECWNDEIAQPQLTAIKGGIHGQPTQQEQHLDAFLAGARGAS